jgi:hypothetical protein
MTDFWHKLKEKFGLDPRFGNFFNKHFFITNMILLITSIIVFLILYKNVVTLNDYVLFIIKVGSLLLLLSLISVIFFLYKIIRTFKSLWRYAGHGWRYAGLFIILLLVILIFLNQEAFINGFKEKVNSINFSNFNPIYIPKEISDSLKEVAIVPSDSQINQCRDSFNKYAEISSGKYGVDVVLLKIEKLTSRDDLDKFINDYGFKENYYSFSADHRTDYAMNSFPIVVLAISIRQSKQLLANTPHVLFCNLDTNTLTAESKAILTG